MPPVITVEHLRKVYGHHVVAVDDVSFEVERGEIFGLLGSNGAGKTTTVECVQGLRTPTGGDGARARQGPACTTPATCAGAWAASCRSRASPTT